MIPFYQYAAILSKNPSFPLNIPQFCQSFSLFSFAFLLHSDFCLAVSIQNLFFFIFHIFKTEAAKFSFNLSCFHFQFTTSKIADLFSSPFYTSYPRLPWKQQTVKTMTKHKWKRQWSKQKIVFAKRSDQNQFLKQRRSSKQKKKGRKI